MQNFSPSQPVDHRFISLFHHSAVCMAIALLDGTLLEVNRAYCDFLGYTAAELLNLKVLDITFPEDRELTTARFREASKGARQFFHYEKRFLHKDGRVVWGLVATSWVHDDPGRPPFCVALIQDITARKDCERALRENEKLYRTLIETVDLGLALIGEDFRVFMSNKVLGRQFCKPPETFIGTECFREFEKQDTACTHCPGTQALTTGKPAEVETEGVRDDCTRFVARVRAFPVLDGNGRARQFVEVVEDITERRKVLADLQASEERFRSFFQNAMAGLIVVTPEGRYLQVNRAFCQFLGYSEEELRGLSVEEVTHPKDLDLTLTAIKNSLSGPPFRMEYEKRFRHKDGSTRWGQVSGVWQLDGAGAPSYAIGLVQDITGRKEAEEELFEKQMRLNFMVYHDALTQLPNRRLFQDRLEHAMARARRSGNQVALIFLDLDHFKKINDSFCHQMGDRVLRQVAATLKSAIREEDSLARFGGDEFTVVVEGIENQKQAAIVAEKTLGAISRPIEMDQHRFFLSASIGISLFPADGQSGEDLMKAADVAMYRAKELGRNTYQFYSADMNARSGELLFLGNDLRQAIELDQLELHYQPQIDLRTGRMVAAEALLRWHHPKLGMIPPADFIPIAEENGLIVPMGEWVIRQACAQAKKWQAQWSSAVRVAVNVSGRQFLRSDLGGTVRRALAETGLDPVLLELEITESIIVKDVGLAIRVMQDLNSMGVQIAIDDFGTGYSSLSYLQQFPIQRLKIDRTFIREVTATAKGTAITGAVIALGKELNLEVVAEGIETEEQLRILREMGCDCGQGYFLGRPTPHLDPTNQATKTEEQGETNRKSLKNSSIFPAN